MNFYDLMEKQVPTEGTCFSVQSILFTNLFCLLHDFLVRANNILVHLSLHLFLYRRNRKHSAHQFHLQNTLLLLLREIVDAVGLIKLVVVFSRCRWYNTNDSNIPKERE